MAGEGLGDDLNFGLDVVDVEPHVRIYFSVHVLADDGLRENPRRFARVPEESPLRVSGNEGLRTVGNGDDRRGGVFFVGASTFFACESDCRGSGACSACVCFPYMFFSTLMCCP